MPRLLLLLLVGFVTLVACVPSGFVDETVADIVAITGAFAPNPRKGEKPMLLLSAKTGTIYVLEDPDNSDTTFAVAALGSRMCNEGERGLQSIRPHPNFTLPPIDTYTCTIRAFPMVATNLHRMDRRTDCPDSQ